MSREASQAAADHVTDQLWVPEVRDDGVYLVDSRDGSTIVKLCRPDRGSDLLIAGYISGLQALKIRPGNLDTDSYVARGTPRPGLRVCPGCDREFALLYICERCGRCSDLDLPRDADRSAPCCAEDGGECVEVDWRARDGVVA